MTLHSSDREADYLAYIRDCIHRIEERSVGGREAFFDSDVLQDAVIRRLETLADASQHLSAALKQRHPEIPWRTIVDFCNRVAHGYLNIDLERVWDVIEGDLPPLKGVVEQELRERGHTTDSR